MNKEKIQFGYQYCGTLEQVRKHIQECEGEHSQQVAFSTFHHALTQICFGCRKIRTNIKIYPNYEKQTR